MLLLGILAGFLPVYEFVRSGFTEVRTLPAGDPGFGPGPASSILGFLGIILHAVNWRFKELHNVMVRRHN